MYTSQTFQTKTAQVLSKAALLAFIGLLPFLLALTYSQKAHAVDTAANACQFEASPCTIPFFVVQGGDVAGGSGFTNYLPNGWNQGPGNCTGQTAGMFFGGYNNDNHDNGNSGYYGAAVQGSTMNPDTSEELPSDINSDKPLSPNTNYNYNGLVHGQGNVSVFTQSPYYLAFGNADNPKWGVDLSSHYGGEFWGANGNSGAPCIPDAYLNAGNGNNTLLSSVGAAGGFTGGNTIDLSKLPSGAYSYYGATKTTDATLIVNDSAPIPPSRDIVITVFGNVSIQSNITYCSSTSPCGTNYILSTIPSVQISAAGSNNNGWNGDGNIFIGKNVSEIHGFFTAESGPDNGAIHTCGTSDSDANTEDASLTNCGTQLSIYGAMETDYFYLERSYGDVLTMTHGSTNSSNAAEVFRYSPELWIPDANGSPVVSGGGSCSGTPGTFNTVGSLVTNSGNGLTTLPVNAQCAGDVWIVTMFVHIPGHVTVSDSAGADQWTPIQQVNDGTGYDYEEWMGKINTTGPTSIKITGSGGNTAELNAQEFTANYVSGTTTWTVDKSGANVAKTGATAYFPTLTPSGSNELYVGYTLTINNPATPPCNTPGFSYQLTNDSNSFTDNPNVSMSGGPYAPTACQNPSGGYDSVGAVLQATGSSGGGGGGTGWQAVTSLPPVL